MTSVLFFVAERTQSPNLYEPGKLLPVTVMVPPQLPEAVLVDFCGKVKSPVTATLYCPGTAFALPLNGTFCASASVDANSNTGEKRKDRFITMDSYLLSGTVVYITTVMSLCYT